MSVSEVAYEIDGWGVGTLWFADTLLVWHELPHPRDDSPDPGAPQPTTRIHRNAENRTQGKRDRAEGVPIAPRLIRSLERYFTGKRVDLATVPIDLDWCTPFQRSVAETLRAVPFGEVVTYAELAALAGHPNAQRAVGTFCANNRLPLVIPCHRVVSSDGIGGYGSLGAAFKRRLLALEGVRL